MLCDMLMAVLPSGDFVSKSNFTKMQRSFCYHDSQDNIGEFLTNKIAQHDIIVTAAQYYYAANFSDIKNK